MRIEKKNRETDFRNSDPNKKTVKTKGDRRYHPNLKRKKNETISKNDFPYLESALIADPTLSGIVAKTRNKTRSTTIVYASYFTTRG